MHKISTPDVHHPLCTMYSVQSTVIIHPVDWRAQSCDTGTYRDEGNVSFSKPNPPKKTSSAVILIISTCLSVSMRGWSELKFGLILCCRVILDQFWRGSGFENHSMAVVFDKKTLKFWICHGSRGNCTWKTARVFFKSGNLFFKTSLSYYSYTQNTWLYIFTESEEEIVPMKKTWRNRTLV